MKAVVVCSGSAYHTKKVPFKALMRKCGLRWTGTQWNPKWTCDTLACVAEFERVGGVTQTARFTINGTDAEGAQALIAYAVRELDGVLKTEVADWQIAVREGLAEWTQEPLNTMTGRLRALFFKRDVPPVCAVRYEMRAFLSRYIRRMGELREEHEPKEDVARVESVPSVPSERVAIKGGLLDSLGLGDPEPASAVAQSTPVKRRVRRVRRVRREEEPAPHGVLQDLGI